MPRPWQQQQQAEQVRALSVEERKRGRAMTSCFSPIRARRNGRMQLFGKLPIQLHVSSAYLDPHCIFITLIAYPASILPLLTKSHITMSGAPEAEKAKQSMLQSAKVWGGKLA
jgi:hypothetical protein